MAFEHLADENAPVVFYRLGGASGHNPFFGIALHALAIHVFATKREADGFFRRDEWRVWFYPGQKDEIEESHRSDPLVAARFKLSQNALPRVFTTLDFWHDNWRQLTE